MTIVDRVCAMSAFSCPPLLVGEYGKCTRLEAMGLDVESNLNAHTRFSGPFRTFRFRSLFQRLNLANQRRWLCRALNWIVNEIAPRFAMEVFGYRGKLCRNSRDWESRVWDS